MGASSFWTSGSAGYSCASLNVMISCHWEALFSFLWRMLQSGGARSGGARSGGARSGGAQSGGARSGGAQSGGARSGGAQSGGAQSGGARSGGAAERRDLNKIN